MMIDTHCHLHDPAYADLADTLRVARTHDVWGVIAVGTDAATNAQTLAPAPSRAAWWVETMPSFRAL